MTRSSKAPRLFVDAPLSAGSEIALGEAAAHYLVTVMRAQPGDTVLLFNGKDGEWRAEVAKPGKRKCLVRVTEQSREQTAQRDLWLVFAPLKRARIDYMAQKATEMGVSDLVPVITKRTSVTRVNTQRMRANAIEAAEQCELLTIPKVHEPQPLEDLLDHWPAARNLMFCDESGDGAEVISALKAAGPGTAGHPWAVIIGPEGGFEAGEMALLSELPGSVPVSLGPRIMRADTAAVAALAVFQAVLGDWE